MGGAELDPRALSLRFGLPSRTCSRLVLHRRLRKRCPLAERVLQVDGNAVLPEQIGEGLVRQLLDGRHPVAAELLQLVESVVVEGDQLAHACSLRQPEPRQNRAGNGQWFLLGLSPDRQGYQMLNRSRRLHSVPGTLRSMHLSYR